MMTREQAAREVERLFREGVDKTEHVDKGSNMGQPHHVGLTEFRCLLDAIYGPPTTEAEKIKS